MFKIENEPNVDNSYWIIDSRDGDYNFLHSDGSVLSTAEYWPTYKQAMAVLDKYYPKPKHEWKHGDVFLYSGYRSAGGINHMMYILVPDSSGPNQKVRVPKVIYLNEFPVAWGNVEDYLEDAEYLFNIEEKLLMFNEEA